MNVLCRDSQAENSSAQPLALLALLGTTSFYSNPCPDPTMMSDNCLDVVLFGCDAKPAFKRPTPKKSQCCNTRPPPLGRASKGS